MSEWSNVLNEILDHAVTEVSNISPSEWAEKFRYMTSDVSPIPGYFRFENSPYTKEIIDCLSPYHPARQIAVMKGAQIGFSTAVIENGIGWIISEQPGNILFLVGHEDLLKDSVKKLDRMIDSTGIRSLIRATTQRQRNTKSGDTDGIKEYPGGYLKLAVANHKILRQISMQYGFIDDYENMKSEAKESGSTYEMINKRFSAYRKKKKVFFISTPELKEKSNILHVYLQGDQRKWHIPCPCCGEFIVLHWTIENELKEGEICGITWQMDENNELIEESVGYICQKCGNFFDDTKKSEFINAGKWVPTAKPSQPGYYSYHISSLYAPIYMDSWRDYVYKWIDMHPEGGNRVEKDYKTFINLVLGECYEPDTEGIAANSLQENNIRPYKIGVIPEKLSISDGNGKIVLLTCGIDMNGKLDDARIDFEIKAWSENESTYSILHGSIGTFVNFDKGHVDRERWTYRIGAKNNVWTELNKILGTQFISDTGRKMGIGFSCLDTGYLNEYAYPFVDKSNFNIVSVKGDKDTVYVDKYADKKTFKQSKEKANLFLIETNYTKDLLAEKLKIKWSKNQGDSQPSGFINFPTPSDGLYLYSNFFSHYEAEHKVFDEKSLKFVWKKKKDNVQNHLFDCGLYNNVARDIIMTKIFRERKIQNGTWKDFVQLIEKK